MQMLNFLSRAAIAGCFALIINTTTQAEIVEYYVARDSLSTIASGTYSGLANPNANSLTMLYAHSYPDPALGLPGDNWTINHYHSKGTYSYTGGQNLGAATPINDFNGTYGSSNILPESPLINDIVMKSGSGAFSGLFRTGIDTSADFNNLRIRSVNSLSGFAADTGESYMFNSSSGRWSGLLDNSNVRLNLVGIDSGLSIRDDNGNILMQNAGDFVDLGPGDSIDFTPIFSAANLGTYRATFNLSSPDATYGNGGRFIFEVTAVPEPATASLMLMPMAGYAIRRYRNRRRTIMATLTN